ncbi:MAG: ABC transporter permease [Chloroflexota bacterium]|nr:ABC transporter permease [Chloroflexota bacterium]
MIKYTLRRLFQAIPTFFGITILSYLLLWFAPGDPVSLLTFSPSTTPADRERLAARLGVNDPITVQYLRWLAGDDWMRIDDDGDNISDRCFILPCDADGDGVNEPPGERYGIIRGDFGRSFTRPRNVIDLIAERIPATLELGAISLMLGLVVGVPTGIFAAVRKGSGFDNFTRVSSVVFSAVPIFWLGLILILLFGRVLFPNLSPNPFMLGGQCPPVLIGGCPPLQGRLLYIFLPAFVLAAQVIAVYSRFMRASMLDVIGQDYMRTAHSKGLSRRTVWFRHGARNALIPLATFLGPAITGLLGGAVLTETIFSWPGLGRLGFESVIQQDYPMVMAFVIIGSLATIVGYILSDILYALIDPRIRFD